MHFVREDIPWKHLYAQNHSMEDFYVEVNLRKTKLSSFVALTTQLDAKLIFTEKILTKV